MPRPQRTQHDQRRFIAPVDQFGRQWSMTIEIATGEPTGGIFHGSWEDPLRTPQKHVGMARQGESTVLGQCRVDFDRWIAENEADEQRWYKQLFENAQTIYKKLEPGDVKNLEHDAYLLQLTGPKPFPATSCLRRAAGGYKPFLGLAPLSPQDRIDLAMPTLEDYTSGAVKVAAEALAETPTIPAPPETYKEFLAWAFKHGGAKSLTEAAAAWREHREALAQPA